MNILISDKGIARLADFGVLRATQDATTPLNSIIGGPNFDFYRYIAPELFSKLRGGDLSKESDVYSLAMTTYEVSCLSLFAMVTSIVDSLLGSHR